MINAPDRLDALPLLLRLLHFPELLARQLLLQLNGLQRAGRLPVHHAVRGVLDLRELLPRDVLVAVVGLLALPVPLLLQARALLLVLRNALQHLIIGAAGIASQ